MIPFNVLNKKKTELINKGFIVEIFFGNLKNIKKKAVEKNCHSYLVDDQIIKLDK